MYKFVDGNRFLFKDCKVWFFNLLRKTFISRVRKISRRDLRDHGVQFPVWPTRKGCQATGPEFAAKLEPMCCSTVYCLRTCAKMFKRPGRAGSAERKGVLFPFPPQSLHCLRSSSNEFNEHFYFFLLSFPCLSNFSAWDCFIHHRRASLSSSRKQPFTGWGIQAAWYLVTSELNQSRLGKNLN